MYATESEESAATCLGCPLWDLLSVLEGRTKNVSGTAPNASPLEMLAGDAGATEDLDWCPSV